MTAKRLKVRKIVDLKFAASPNKNLRRLRRWLTFQEKMFPLHSLGTHFLRNKFQWLLAKYTRIKDLNGVKVLPKPSV